ncbi:MAG TPA: MOSC domain-containing protein [Vicinamibacterales bacterium]|nr:MOSC domain-containing protein [Vicinamibacterales bacterium]
MTMPRVEAINVSRGGVPKTAIFETMITVDGVAGDRQADPRFHGGPDRAVVLFSLDVIAKLQAEGHPITAGTTGENLTRSGIDWATLGPGAELTIGAARLAITKYASPCYKIGGSFLDDNFLRISQKLHPGWSRLCARVVVEGLVTVGDAVTLSSA